MSDPVSVLVLYDHPLLGEGLSALMASVPGLQVERIAMGDPDAMERAVAANADVVILEEGGRWACSTSFGAAAAGRSST